MHQKGFPEVRRQFAAGHNDCQDEQRVSKMTGVRRKTRRRQKLGDPKRKWCLTENERAMGKAKLECLSTILKGWNSFDNQKYYETNAAFYLHDYYYPLLSIRLPAVLFVLENLIRRKTELIRQSSTNEGEIIQRCTDSITYTPSVSSVTTASGSREEMGTLEQVQKRERKYKVFALAMCLQLLALARKEDNLLQQYNLFDQFGSILRFLRILGLSRTVADIEARAGLLQSHILFAMRNTVSSILYQPYELHLVKSNTIRKWIISFMRAWVPSDVDSLGSDQLKSRRKHSQDSGSFPQTLCINDLKFLDTLIKSARSASWFESTVLTAMEKWHAELDSHTVEPLLKSDEKKCNYVVNHHQHTSHRQERRSSKMYLYSPKYYATAIPCGLMYLSPMMYTAGAHHIYPQVFSVLDLDELCKHIVHYHIVIHKATGVGKKEGLKLYRPEDHSGVVELAKMALQTVFLSDFFTQQPAHARVRTMYKKYATFTFAATGLLPGAKVVNDLLIESVKPIFDQLSSQIQPDCDNNNASQERVQDLVMSVLSVHKQHVYVMRRADMLITLFEDLSEWSKRDDDQLFDKSWLTTLYEEMQVIRDFIADRY